MQIFSGFLLGSLIAAAAYRLKALSLSGALAAAGVGTLVFGLGGLPWAVVLLTFFVSSSGLSRAFGRRKAALAEKFAKGSRRDWGQVLANGGVGAALAVAQAIWPEAAWPWLAFVGSLAAVNADTWATELGVLSRQPPRLISTGQPVERGTSGGITTTGSLAALAGAGLVGLAAVLARPVDIRPVLTLAAACLGGLAGAMFDSLLGATVQAIYSCPACQKETERHPLHLCGTATRYVRGWRWCNNEVVNVSCAVVGAIVAAILGAGLGA